MTADRCSIHCRQALASAGSNSAQVHHLCALSLVNSQCAYTREVKITAGVALMSWLPRITLRSRVTDIDLTLIYMTLMIVTLLGMTLMNLTLLYMTSMNLTLLYMTLMILTLLYMTLMNLTLLYITCLLYTSPSPRD